MMFDAIMSDVQSAEGSGSTTMGAILRVKSAASSVEELGGTLGTRTYRKVACVSKVNTTKGKEAR